MDSQVEALGRENEVLQKEILELRSSSGSMHKALMELKGMMGTLLKEKKKPY